MSVWTRWMDRLYLPGFRWANSVTGKPVFFCSRFCAAKFEVRWVEPVEERTRCATCNH